MLKEKIHETLTERGPLTIGQLEQALGVPRTLLRTALLPDFYEQREIVHPKHGNMTVWATVPPTLEIISDRYAVPTQTNGSGPEPEPIKIEENVAYADRKGRALAVTRVNLDWIEGLLFEDDDDGPPKPYGTDTTTFRKVWVERVPTMEDTA